MHKHNRHIYLLCIVLALLLTGCEWVHKYHKGNALVEIDDQKLYQTEVDELTRGAATPEDSARIAQAYIAQWTADATLYAKARRAIGNDKQIQSLVATYERALYLHAYKEWLVENEMPKHVSIDSIQAYYEAHPQQFVLQENLVQGLLLVVPNDAPRKKRLKEDLQAMNKNNMEEHAKLLEKIEKYAYQNASGYELFTEQWQTTQNIILRMPMEQNNFSQLLKKNDLIEMSDSVNTYFLCVTDKRLVGEPMPLEYAQKEIEQIILNKRKIEFINNIR